MVCSPSTNTSLIRPLKSFLILVILAALGLYVMDLRRQIDEVGEEVSQMHKDFLAEAYLRYGGPADGQE